MHTGDPSIREGWGHEHVGTPFADEPPGGPASRADGEADPGDAGRPDGYGPDPRGAAVGAAPGRGLLGRPGRGHGRGAGGGEAGHPWGRRRRLPAARRVSAARSRPVDPVCGAHRRGGGRGHPPRAGGARRGWPAPRRSGPRRLRRARLRHLRRLVGGGRAEKSGTRGIRSTASTSCQARTGSGSSSKARCWRSRAGLCCCSRRCFRPASTCAARTSGWS